MIFVFLQYSFVLLFALSVLARVVSRLCWQWPWPDPQHGWPLSPNLWHACYSWNLLRYHVSWASNFQHLPWTLTCDGQVTCKPLTFPSIADKTTHQKRTVMASTATEDQQFYDSLLDLPVQFSTHSGTAVRAGLLVFVFQIKSYLHHHAVRAGLLVFVFQIKSYLHHHAVRAGLLVFVFQIKSYIHHHAVRAGLLVFVFQIKSYLHHHAVRAGLLVFVFQIKSYLHHHAVRAGLLVFVFQIKSYLHHHAVRAGLLVFVFQIKSYIHHHAVRAGLLVFVFQIKS